MRVKLSYTAEIEEVLEETSLLLGNLANTFQESIDLYNATVNNLKEEEFNGIKFQNDVDTLRKNLAKIDTRYLEIEQVVMGLEDYRRQQRADTPEVEDSMPEGSPSVSHEETEEGDD
jgi:molybdopterin converting factor small subunit